MTFIFDLIKTIIMGFIQGVTEWLPISSTAHLIIFNEVFPMLPEEFFEVFKVVIQFGSILAVCALYFKTLNPFDSSKNSKERQDTIDLWIKVIIGALPAAIIGLLLDDFIESKLSHIFVIAVTLIAYGIVFIVVEREMPSPSIKTTRQLDYKTAIKIGLFQCLALIPGTSRSGATILGGLATGCSRTVASEFSFFLAIPTMLGASGLKILKYILDSGFFSLGQLILLLLGMAVSYVVSLVAIRKLLHYVRKHDFTVFGWYRIALGIAIIFIFVIL